MSVVTRLPIHLLPSLAGGNCSVRLSSIHSSWFVKCPMLAWGSWLHAAGGCQLGLRQFIFGGLGVPSIGWSPYWTILSHWSSTVPEVRMGIGQHSLKHDSGSLLCVPTSNTWWWVSGVEAYLAWRHNPITWQRMHALWTPPSTKEVTPPWTRPYAAILSAPAFHVWHWPILFHRVLFWRWLFFSVQRLLAFARSFHTFSCMLHRTGKLTN